MDSSVQGLERPSVVDLFSGCGGISLGFEEGGFDILAAVDYDPVHCATFAYNFPLTEVCCADMRNVDESRLVKAIEGGARRHGRLSSEVDVLVAGIPSQGFSAGGRRRISDERNSLATEIVKAAAALAPKYLLIESVPGANSGEHAVWLHRLMYALDRIGYHAGIPRILDAAAYGIPQVRRRLLLMATRSDLKLPALPGPLCQPVYKRPPGMRLRPSGDLPLGPNVLDALGDLPDVERFEALSEGDFVVLDPAELEAMKENRSSYAESLADPALSAGFARRRSWDPGLLTSSRRTLHSEETRARFAKTEPGEAEPKSRLYRLHPAGLSSTLRAGTGRERGSFTSSRPIHPRYPRVITVREAARLQSFPDWFRFHTTKWHGFRQVGNAAPPQLMRLIAERLAKALGRVPELPADSNAEVSSELLAFDMSAAADFFGVASSELPPPRRRHRAPEKAATSNG